MHQHKYVLKHIEVHVWVPSRWNDTLNIRMPVQGWGAQVNAPVAAQVVLR